MQFTQDQQKAIDARGKNILVAAAAGSGKTRVLVERIIRQLLNREFSIDEILVVTFTNAAAAEMRERIELALNERLDTETDAKMIGWLERQIVLLTGASIETFHAFCQKIIRQYIDAIDVDPEFRLASEQEMVLLKRDVLEDLLEKNYERPTTDFISFVDDYGDDHGDDKVLEYILKLYHFSQSKPFPQKWLLEQPAKFAVGENVVASPWVKIAAASAISQLNSIKKAYETDINELVRTKKLSDLTAWRPYAAVVDDDFMQVEELINELNACKNTCRKGLFDSSCAAASKIKFLELRKKDYKELKETLPEVREKFDEQRGSFKKAVDSAINKYLSSTEEEIADSLVKQQKVISEYTRLVMEFMDRLKDAKRERNILDFNDLEHYALEILCRLDENGEVTPTAVADAVRDEFKAIMVDEYQDTNSVQETILNQIARPTNRFIVGDVKQSIYRFRLTDAKLFQDKYNTFPENPSVDEPNQLITMRQNFRSRGTVLAPINYIFDQIMTLEAAEIDYDERSRLYEGADFPKASQKNLESPVELGLIMSGEFEIDKEVNTETNSGEDSDNNAESLTGFNLEAQYIAERIDDLMTLEKPAVFDSGKYRQLEYRDIAILMRTVSGKANILLETLKQASIPAYAEVDGGYFEAGEVRIILALLAIIDNARQDIELAAVLASPLGGFSMTELAKIRVASADGDLYDGLLASFAADTILDSDLAERAANFLQEIADFRDYSVSHSVPELIWLIYRQTGYYDYVGSLKGGLLRQANLRMLADRAAEYENTNYRGLFRFLRYIEALKKRKTDLAVARTLGANENVVRIMSIHKSKGLEFPVVIVADLGKSFNLTDAKDTFLLHKELGIGGKLVSRSRAGQQIYKTLPWTIIADKIIAETKAEEMRILYVALTRAKEKLILTGTVNKNRLLKKIAYWAKYVHRESIKLPTDFIMSASSYLDWVAPAIMSHADGEPLRFSMENKEYNKTFSKLEPKAHFEIKLKESYDVEQQLVTDNTDDELLTAIKNLKKIPASSSKKKIENILSWHYDSQGLENVPTKLTVTELKERFNTNEYSELERAKSLLPEDKEWARPRFLEENTIDAAARGTILHKVMQHIDFFGDTSLAAIKAQLAALTASGILKAGEADVVYLKGIQGFLKSPLGERLHKAKNIYRELPFSRTLKATDFYAEVQDNSATVFTQGVIDLLFEDENSQLVLVDYKTDRKPSVAKAKARYSVQLKLYREAVEKILNRKVAESYIYLLQSGEIVPMQ